MERREFFKTLALGAFAAQFGVGASLRADDSVPLDENMIAIFSDPHLRQPETIRQVVRFKQVVANVLALNPRPARLLIYGDIAYDAGFVEDYAYFKELVKPIEDAGIQWETAMGNHDRLENFRKVFPERADASSVPGRYVKVVETPHADFILLDSYLKGQVRGEISAEQKDWIAETLKKYTDKPVFVGCHHPLKETELAETFKSCPKFAAFLHGHYHYYRSPVDSDLQTICFPSVGCWGDLGFMVANVTEKEAVFAPHIDAYLWAKWGYVKEPEKNVEEYIEKLNANSPVVKFS